MMSIEELIDFLETDTIDFTFSDKGLKSLHLKAGRAPQSVDLKRFDRNREQSPVEKLIVRETLNFLDTGRHSMPLDLSSFTDFQQSVFRIARGVEPGHIITYKGIAEILGKPGAAQAVGSAIAKNPVCYFLPTHRVLPQRGLGICRTGAGYLREKLLVHEGHDLALLRGNYVCTRKKCCIDEKL